MNLRVYYNSGFSQDLATLLQGIRPPEARIVTLGHDWVNRCSLLERIPPERRPSFLACLHLTVLVDQVMHSHFAACYAEFEQLTMYPKFRVGLGHPAYLNPIRIFEDPIRCSLVAASDIRALAPEAMQVFVTETVDFFTKHMPQVAVVDFFARLLADPEVAPQHRESEVTPDNLPLSQLVAQELKKAVRACG